MTFLFKVNLGKEIALVVLKHLGLKKRVVGFFPPLQFYGPTTKLLTPLILKLSPLNIPYILSLTSSNF